MTYVVAGITGNTGKVVAETLLEAGETVRVVVREASKGDAFRAKGAEVAVADLGDADALARALEGAKGAYLLIPPFHGVDDFYAEQRRVADSIATAVERAGVPHVVFLSSIGAHLPAGTGPIKGVGYAESRLRKVATATFTFLRPSYFMENFAGSLGGLEAGVFATFLEETRAIPMIATVDIGRVAARVLREGVKGTRVIELAGPVEVSPRFASEVFGTLVGRPLRVEVGPTSVMADVLTGFGVDRDLARLYAEMTESFNAGRIDFERSGTFERGATGLDVVARSLLAQ